MKKKPFLPCYSRTCYLDVPRLVLAWSLLLVCGCTDYRHPDFTVSQSGDYPTDYLNQYVDPSTTLPILADASTRQKLDSLLRWTDLLKNYREEVALEYAKEANRVATEEQMQFSKAIAMYYMAMLKGRRQIFGEGITDAMVDAKISQQIIAQRDRADWKGRINGLLGLLYYRKSEPDTALYFLNQALAALEVATVAQQDVEYLKGEILHDIGNVYYGMDSLPRAAEYYEKAQTYYIRSKHQTAIARLWRAQGNLHMVQGHFAKADSLFQLSLTYALTNNDQNNLAEVYREFGNLRQFQYKATSDSTFFVEGLDYLTKARNTQNENFYLTYELIGITYQRAIRLNPAYVDSALVYYKMAMENAREEGALNVFFVISKNVSNLCDWLQRKGKDCDDILDDSTLKFFNANYSGIVDTIAGNITDANQEYVTYELGAMASANERKSKNQWLLSGTILVFAALVFLLMLQRQQKKRLEARMEALRAQINPHFVSNSLNAIESLVNLDQREAAAKYIIHFSRLSRRILNGSLDANTSLADELQTLEHFLALEQLRFRDKLKYEIVVSPGLNAQLIQVPAMMLQPYVENAIWHGLKPKHGPGELRISAERSGKFLRLTIEDNGVGREKAAELKAKSVLKHKSVGMKITQERIQAVGNFRGSKVEITDLHGTGGNALGTRVVIRIPFKLKKEKSA